ncbi:hypothetical protein DQ238_11020 [Geodermatophilus sp. TF02-6]|uniref:hypothetical protein n=1 Tax=Geodermatophilus sp. TF02-6 TaxID=2250575 RepID=UPI000DEA47EC|nr:hypothetical protein [Geodermatophilus sp. TF02-6]RBY78914.1 hypothetical protein DQ238_11020 [Geodermatophilus sp. TF02-6]
MSNARRVHAHDAVVALPEDDDERAPGGAVTLALCGSWTHEPPCPLASHATTAARADGELRLRVLFACDPDDEPRVRRLVQEALARGECEGPDGVRTTWRLLRAGASAVRPDERGHAARLAGG